jgi:hypothetical protein
MVGIEVAADPFLELSVASVRGIADDIEEFGPADGRLQGQVQSVETDVERHLDAAQNRGRDSIESDFEAGDGGGAHAATLWRSVSAAQFHGKSGLDAPLHRLEWVRFAKSGAFVLLLSYR